MAKVFLLFALLATPAWGVITVLQHTHNHAWSVGATVSCTLNPTAAGSSIIVGAASAGVAGSVSGVAGVTDNHINVYVQASGSRGVYTSGVHSTEVWHKLSATAGITSVSITFAASTVDATIKVCHVFEISGVSAFDVAGHLDVGACVSNVCTGASVTTTSSAGFVLGLIEVDPVSSCPNPGNEFTGPCDLDMDGFSATDSLISTTAASHQPAWHATEAAATFTSSTAAYK